MIGVGPAAHVRACRAALPRPCGALAGAARCVCAGAALLLALAAAAAPVAAQDAAPRVRARVTYIAGSNVYFDAGSGQGIRAQDTLVVLREADGARLGAVVVLSVTDARAVATFAGRPFALTRGTALLLELPGDGAAAAVTGVDSAAAAAKAADERTRAEPAAAPAAARAAEPARAQHAAGPRLDGRLALDFEATRTASNPSVGPAWRDDVAAPTLRLRAAVTRLPGGLRLETNLRAAYRRSSLGLLEASPSLRVYQASVEKELAAFPLQLRLGRFYNPYESYGGYVDGMLLRVGRQRLGAGVAFGYTPTLGNEGLSTDLPRLSAFVDFHHRGRALRYDMDLSFHDERPRSDSLPVRRYLGWSQHLAWNGFRIGQRLQAGRARGTGEWLVSHLELFAAAPLAAGLHLNGRYVLQHPESLPFAPGLPAERRERASAGLLLVRGGGSASVDAGVLRTQAGGTGRSLAASFLLPRTTLLALGFGASAGYSSDDRYTSYYVSPSVTRELGASRVRGALQVYGSEGALGDATYYSSELSVTFPLRQGAAGTLGARHRTGGGLTSSQLLASIWTSF